MAIEKRWLYIIAQRGSATAADVATATGTDRSFLSRSVHAKSESGLTVSLSLMWLHTSGKERTEGEWTALCEGVGLEIVKIWSAENGGGL